jgi:hypothetical protein
VTAYLNASQWDLNSEDGASEFCSFQHAVTSDIRAQYSVILRVRDMCVCVCVCVCVWVGL